MVKLRNKLSYFCHLMKIPRGFCTYDACFVKTDAISCYLY